MNEATDTEDEDVLFENSPLHQHLKETGLDDIMLDTQERTLPSIPRQERETENLFVWTKTFIQYVLDSLSVMFTINLLYEDMDRLLNVFRLKTVKVITSSKLLDEDDRNFLENALKDIDGESNVSIRPKFLFVLTLPCVLAYLYSRVMYPDLPWKYTAVTDITATVCLLYLIFITVKSGILYYTKWIYSQHFNKMEDLVRGSSLLTQCLRKSLRLIQESELIVRGFTLVSQQSAVLRLEQNSLHNSQRQCPQLRFRLFHASRQCMLLAKERTLQLLKIYPLGAEIDGVLHYLANVPLVEYGPCLQIKGDDELYSITDGFSVAALKGMKQLCELHLSEMFRRLVLTVYHSDISKDTRFLGDFLKSLTESLKHESEKLHRSYMSHSCFLLDKSIKQPKTKVVQSQSPLKDVYMTVHSLDLHLQAAWLRVKSLSSLLEQQVDHDENTGILPPDEQYEKLQQHIKQELLSCKACWEEGIARLEKLGKNTDKSSEIPKVSCPKPSEDQDKPPLVPLVDMGDPVIEDQVFEAYIEDDVDRGENSWDEFITQEEKARRKKEKQEAVRVLTELKSVLSVRAEEWEIRERLALDRAAQTTSRNSGITEKPSSDIQNQVNDHSSDTLRELNTPHSSESVQEKSDLCAQSQEKFSQCESPPGRTYHGEQQDMTGHSEMKTLKSSTCHDISDNSAPFAEQTAEKAIPTTSDVSDTQALDSIMGCGDNKNDTNTEFVKNKITNCGPAEKKVLFNDSYVPHENSDELCIRFEDQDHRMSSDDTLNSERLPIVYQRHRAQLDSDEQCYLPVCTDQSTSETVEERFSRLSGANMLFSSSLAAQAAARSRGIGLAETTFGDDDDSDITDDS